MSNKALLKVLKNNLGGGRIKKDIILAPYTTFKIGGKAEFYFEAYSKEDLIKSYTSCKETGLKFILLGSGSNVIVISRVIHGLAVRNLYKDIEIVKENNIEAKIIVSSGYIINKLAEETINKGLSGFEYFAGMPGTVGGALFMNSKWRSESKEKKSFVSVGDHLLSAEIIDNNGRVKNVNRDYFQFSYGNSILQKTKEVILTVVFLLKRKNKELLKKRADETLLYRQKTQPIGFFSAGCFFRNKDKISTGQLIEKLSLKGFSVGNFYISPKHSNFIIHKGGGKSEDLIKLIQIIKNKVKEKFNIKLEEEAIYIK